MRYSSRLDCLITLHQELSVYVKDKAAKGGAKHPLHTLETSVLSKQQSNEFFSHKCYKKAWPQQILHSDRGSQYVSKEYKRITAGIQCSYSKKAYPWDNACIESFHSLIKREWLNRFKIRDYDHAYRLVFEYLEAFYNTKRIHSHCDYMSPNDYEELYRRIQKDELLTAS